MRSALLLLLLIVMMPVRLMLVLLSMQLIHLKLHQRHNLLTGKGAETFLAATK